MKHIIFMLLSVILVACGSLPIVNTDAASMPVISTETEISTLSIETKGPVAYPDTALIFEQDFEFGPPEGGSDEFTKWEIVEDQSGNHIYCNDLSSDFTIVYFGHDDWVDYAVEVWVKEMEKKEEPYVSLYARYDMQKNLGYYGALNFQTHIANLSYNDPYRQIGSLVYQTEPATWYKLRLEVMGDRIRYFIDDRLVGDGTDSKRSKGRTGFSASSNLKVCIDNVRVWTLVDNNTSDAIPESNLEVVQIYPQVWSYNSPQGVSYEYKVNCVNDYPILETCFLWDIDKVVVTAPDGEEFLLEKDFNFQQYSGETTRRWVLYGPLGAGLPKDGSYTFSFFKDDNIVLARVILVEQNLIPFATEVAVTQEGNGLHVKWQPPVGMTSAMDYKVIIFDDKTGQLAVSQSFPTNAQDVFLPELPLVFGRTYRASVAIFRHDGFSGSDSVLFEWAAP